MLFRLTLIFLLISVTSCVRNDTQDELVIPFISPDKALNDSLPDTLLVAMTYGPAAYFNIMQVDMGYEYELARNFAAFTAKPMKLKIARNEQEMFRMLRKGEVHVISQPVYETKTLKEDFTFVNWQDESHLVLVQRIGINLVTEVSELSGKTIHVIENSVQHQRLDNLNREIGGGIHIALLPDTFTVDNLIEMVISKKIENTIAPYKHARMYKEKHTRLDSRLQVGFKQKNGWLIKSVNTGLLKKMAAWENSPGAEALKSSLYGKYRVNNPYFAGKQRTPRGAISPYDQYFMKYAKRILWDWRMLAAISFHESRFDSGQVSRMGASGLMQLMPRTAANFGLERKNILNPERNIEAGVEYVKSLELMFKKIENREERVKFIIASYNSGPAHILDAMALARKYGKNPYIWFEHVEYYLSLKNEPQYYNDAVVKYGHFRSKETISFVRKVLNTFNKYKGAV